MATLFWSGVLGWQASYAPPDSEKRQCEEAAAKGGHKTEECKTLWERTTTDPVAFFTFCLVIFTGGLTVSTILLWRAGERQIAVTKQSADAAEVAASAAKRSVDHAENSLVTTQRAFVFLKTMESDIAVTVLPDTQERVVVGYTLNPIWQNYGTTPALNCAGNCGSYWVGTNLYSEDTVFKDQPTDSPSQGFSMIGPGGNVRGGDMNIGVQLLIEVWEQRMRLFVFSKIEYDDIFPSSPRHETTYCAEVVLLRDPEYFCRGVLAETDRKDFFRYAVFNRLTRNK